MPKGKGNSLIGNIAEKFEFVSRSEVEITAIGNVTRSQYKLDGKKLVLTGGGQSIVLEVDEKGCFSNQWIGMYCKK